MALSRATDHGAVAKARLRRRATRAAWRESADSSATASDGTASASSTRTLERLRRAASSTTVRWASSACSRCFDVRRQSAPPPRRANTRTARASPARRSARPSGLPGRTRPSGRRRYCGGRGRRRRRRRRAAAPPATTRDGRRRRPPRCAARSSRGSTARISGRASTSRPSSAPGSSRGLYSALEPSGTLLATDGDQPRARSPESADAAVGATGGVAASAGGIACRRARGAGWLPARVVRGVYHGTLAAGAPNGWNGCERARCEKGIFTRHFSARARPLTSATASA